ncbi:MAG TPA: hypothetical protein VJX67_11245, partial [Blastocatellia bacterium]|nr:hypothetical protein [Blastocatellia bacterium]
MTPDGELNVEQVTKLARELTPEERVRVALSIIESLGEPDPMMGQEPKRTPLMTLGGEAFVLLATDTSASILHKGRLVFKLLFDPENFRQSRTEMLGWKDAAPTAEVSNRIRLLRPNGVPEIDDEELGRVYKQAASEVFAAESHRLARELSARLPHMAQLLFDAGVTIVELAVRNDVARHHREQTRSLEDMVKALEPYWEHVKAHLNLAPEDGQPALAALPTEATQGKNEGQPFFDVRRTDDAIIGHVGGEEIFRLRFALTFRPDSFVENLHKSVPIPVPSEDIKSRLRVRYAQRPPDMGEAEIEAAVERVGSEITKVVYVEKAKHIAERIVQN